MSVHLVQTGNLALRELRGLLRQPAYVAITLVQPMVWLLLFSQLFQQVASIPGFGSDSYISFMTPGVLVMTALFGSTWLGMGFIEDMNRGVMNRFLVSPTRRTALLSAKLVNSSTSLVIQVAIIFVVSLVLGARYEGGIAGIGVSLVAVLLLAAGFGSFSNALALIFRQPESLIGIANFLVLPLAFLSSALMAGDLMPGWMRAAATMNPVHWAVEASRAALAGSPDWGVVLLHLGGLAGFAAVLMWLAALAFRSYQRSV